jgi:hypothetical protein
MEKITRWFEENLNKTAFIKIDKKLKYQCQYCGYGKRYIGHAILKPIESDNEDKRESSDIEEISVDFNYFTGCLSYDEEMDYE